MPKQNPYLIPKENIKKVEEVREIENKIPSYEEFMKSYENDESLNDNYELEVDSYGDIGANKSYGPGSSQSSYSDSSDRSRRARHLGKSGVGVTSGIVSRAVTPIVPGVVGAVTTAVGEIGYALSSSSEAKDSWKYTSELGQDMMTGCVVGNVVDNLGLPYGLKKGWDLWQDFQDKGGKDRLMVGYHDFHLASGEKYSSYCDVCKS